MTAELDNKMFNSGELDLVERDPKGVNEHLRVRDLCIIMFMDYPISFFIINFLGNLDRIWFKSTRDLFQITVHNMY